MAKRKVGTINHYFNNIGVAIVDLTSSISTGDTLEIKTSQVEFQQVVDSMEIDYLKVEKAKKGDSVGVKVDQKVKKSDPVYKVT